jgi:hypothetical protein
MLFRGSAALKAAIEAGDAASERETALTCGAALAWGAAKEGRGNSLDVGTSEGEGGGMTRGFFMGVETMR